MYIVLGNICKWYLCLVLEDMVVICIFLFVLLLKIDFLVKLKVWKKGMKDSMVRISIGESCMVFKKFYLRNLLCVFGRLLFVCWKKRL